MWWKWSLYRKRYFDQADEASVDGDAILLGFGQGDLAVADGDVLDGGEVDDFGRDKVRDGIDCGCSVSLF